MTPVGNVWGGSLPSTVITSSPRSRDELPSSSRRSPSGIHAALKKPGRGAHAQLVEVSPFTLTRVQAPEPMSSTKVSQAPTSVCTVTAMRRPSGENNG